MYNNNCDFTHPVVWIWTTIVTVSEFIIKKHVNTKSLNNEHKMWSRY